MPLTKKRNNYYFLRRLITQIKITDYADKAIFVMTITLMLEAGKKIIKFSQHFLTFSVKTLL